MKILGEEMDDVLARISDETDDCPHSSCASPSKNCSVWGTIPLPDNADNPRPGALMLFLSVGTWLTHTNDAHPTRCRLGVQTSLIVSSVILLIFADEMEETRDGEEV